MEMNGVGITMAHGGKMVRACKESFCSLTMKSETLKRPWPRGRSSWLPLLMEVSYNGILNTLGVFNCALGCIRGEFLSLGCDVHSIFGECLTRRAFQQHWRSARQLPTDECCPEPGAGKVEGEAFSQHPGR